MDTSSVNAIKIFCCSHHEDDVWQKRLEVHLSTLVRQGLIHSWNKNQMRAGAVIDSETNAHLNSADIILLLISPDFIASDDCYTVMLKALERYVEGKTWIIPINLRRVTLEDLPIWRFQIMPRGDLPITQWADYDEAFWYVARGIRDVVRNLLEEKDKEAKSNLLMQVRDSFHSETASNEIGTASISYRMINTTEAVLFFHKLMKPEWQIKVLGIVGQGNMGKTHLLTKVFPLLAFQIYNARCIVLDMRNRAHTIPDILRIASSQLGESFLESFIDAHELWTREHDILRNENIKQRNFFLTSHFVKGLSTFNDRPLFLFIDTIEEAQKNKQTWLVDTLLTQLLLLSHVRVILAGRVLPEAHSSYTTFCDTYSLQPILEDKAYIDFCKGLKATLAEQSIRDIAFACDYTPGTFISLVSKFVPRR